MRPVARDLVLKLACRVVAARGNLVAAEPLATDDGMWDGLDALAEQGNELIHGEWRHAPEFEQRWRAFVWLAERALEAFEQWRELRACHVVCDQTCSRCGGPCGLLALDGEPICVRCLDRAEVRT